MKLNPIALFTSLAVVAAGGFGYVATQNPTFLSPVKITSDIAEAPKAEATKPEAKPEQQASAAQPVAPAAPAPMSDAITPSFDTVRVEKGGEAVIAGRATPNSNVVAKLNGQVVATAKSTADGSFVMIPDKPLPIGVGTLTLETTANGVVKVSEQTVAVAVQAPEKGETTVAVLSPDAPTKVLQSATPANNMVSLDSVDYGAAGIINFAGHAAANSAVRVYVDNAFLGETKTDAQGKWAYAGGSTIIAGNYTLRLDQIANDGEVTSRVETPFKRENAVRTAEAAPEAPAAKATQITIKPGDNLWVISRNLYGYGRQYTLLYEANKQLIKNPRLVYPGQVITAPVADAKAQ
ncbi:MAG: LysM peptidoglycan-binding domain-containing protein [Alphaproteobacteria bacterium]|nr:LysM peptidoglycan-binding domain-containing protein [Alphaproteobacteria bacterium]